MQETAKNTQDLLCSQNESKENVRMSRKNKVE